MAGRRRIFPIRGNRGLALNVKRLLIEYPRVARRRQSCQSVSVQRNPTREPMPLKVADREGGTICLTVQGVRAATRQLCGTQAGDAGQEPGRVSQILGIFSKVLKSPGRPAALL